MSYTKTIEQYIHTETVIWDENGNEVAREENQFDASWYDTYSTEEISDEEAEEYL